MKGHKGKFWVPTETDLEKVKAHIANGGTITSLTKVLDMSRQTLFTKIQSNDPRLMRGDQNILQYTIDLARGEQAQKIEDKWWDIIMNPDHKNHYFALKDYYLQVLHKKEPEVIIINESGKELDKSPEEIANLLKEARGHLKVVK